MIGTSYLPEGELIRDTETRAYTSSLDGLKKAMREGRILEGVAVRCSGDLTLTVEVGKFTGTIERDEAVFTQGEPVKDIAIITRVGKPVCFRVLSVTERGGMPVIKLSRRLAQRECVVNYLSGLTPGDIIAAKVTHLEHFGAFVDIGCGVASLLPIDCVSVSRIDHPAERLRVGCMMPVCVKSVERENGMTRRIYVTRRELLGTWEENAALFRVGQTVTGIVRSIESYGIFVELTPNLAGLAEWRDDVSVSQTAAVYIKSIVPEKMKIKLVIVDPYKGISPKRQAFAGCFPSVPQPDENADADDTDSVGTPDTDSPANLAEALHISRWRYSPDCCPRVIETVFDGDGTNNQS